jgi:hypothetical protein
MLLQQAGKLLSFRRQKTRLISFATALCPAASPALIRFRHFLRRSLYARGTKFMQTRFQQERTALIFSSFAPICGEMNKRRREANEIDFPHPGGALGAHCKEMIKIYICMRAAAYCASSPIALSLSPSAGDGAKKKSKKEKKMRERKTTFALSPPHCRQCRVAGLGMNKKIPAYLRLVYAIVSAHRKIWASSHARQNKRRFVVVVL